VKNLKRFWPKHSRTQSTLTSITDWAKKIHLGYQCDRVFPLIEEIPVITPDTIPPQHQQQEQEQEQVKGQYAQQEQKDNVDERGELRAGSEVRTKENSNSIEGASTVGEYMDKQDTIWEIVSKNTPVTEGNNSGIQDDEVVTQHGQKRKQQSISGEPSLKRQKKATLHELLETNDCATAPAIL